MATPPVSGQTDIQDHLQTWILRVYIHCEGCKKKVFKVLQNIDGVYKTVIDAKEHKVTVTGSVSGETLVQKLLKSGKHAEILPESFKAPDKEPAKEGENQKKKKKKESNNKKDDVTIVNDNEVLKDEKTESKDATNDGNGAENDKEKPEQESKDNGGGNENENGGGKKKKKKNKKKKGEKDENNEPKKGDNDDLPKETEDGVKTKNVESSMEQLNLDHPTQMVYAAPYDMPPYYNNNFYPTPGYGVSYNTNYPSAESSVYTPPVYGYAQSHPSGYYPMPPPPSYYPRSVFDDHDDGGEGKGYCAIM